MLWKLGFEANQFQSLRNMEQLIHITATYSNALLVAILPHISDVAKKLDLPIPQPITTNQVMRFAPSPYKGHFSGSVVLTNDYWFSFDQRGFVDSFRAPTNWFSANDDIADHPERYSGTTLMTTNEIVAFARNTLLKLGYPPEITHSDLTPQLQGPSVLNSGLHICYARVEWKPIQDLDNNAYTDARVDINTHDNTVVGLYLFFKTNQVSTPLQINVEPETQEQFMQRTKARLFVRTNAPSHLPRTGSDHD
jgi:hypothetical protein